MCYTAQDSINAFIFSIVSSTLLYYNSQSNDLKILALFLGFVGHMQLFDYIFWINAECGKANKLATKFAIVFNHLQPIVLYLLIKYFGYSQSRLSTIIIIVYTLFMVNYTIKLWPDENCNETTPVCCSLPIEPSNKETVIDWQWNYQPNATIVNSLFLLSFVVSGMDLKENKLLFILLSVGSFFISTKIPKLNQAVGRAWCYLASLVPAIILLVKKL